MTTQEKPWDIQRQELPDFKNDIHTTDEAYRPVRFQLDHLCLELLTFKHYTESKEQYLSLLRYILGDNSNNEYLEENSLIIMATMIKKNIRNIHSQLLNINSDEFKKNSISEEQVCQYMLQRIQQEYEFVSNIRLDFVPDPKNLPSKTPSENENDLIRSAHFYEDVLNNRNVSTNDIYKILLCLLNTQEEIEKKYIDVSRLLCMENGTVIAAQAWCLDKLVAITSDADAIQKILSSWKRNNLDVQMNSYPSFRACIDETFALSLLIKSTETETLTKFNGKQLAWIAKVHQKFVPELLKHFDVLLKLDGNQLFGIAETHHDFAPALLKNPDVLLKLDGDQLFGIAQAHHDFALALLKNTDVLPKLDGDQLSGIAETHHDFALELLKKTDVLLKLDGNQLLGIAETHHDFALGLLKKTDVLLKLDGNQLLGIAETHHDFALGLLDKPNVLLRLQGNQLYWIARARHDFALELLKKTDVLLKLDGYQLLGIAETHHDFALGLLDKPNVLLRLQGSQLYWIARASHDFALGLLDKPNVLLRLQDNQLSGIALEHSEFGIKYLLLQQEAKNSLESPYSKFVSENKSVRDNILTILNLTHPHKGWFLSGHWNGEYLPGANDLIEQLQNLNNDSKPEQIKEILVKAYKSILQKTPNIDFKKLNTISYVRQLAYCYHLVTQTSAESVHQNHITGISFPSNS